MIVRVLQLTAVATLQGDATVAFAQALYDPNVASQSATASDLAAPVGEAWVYGAGQYEECATITFEGGGQGAPVGEVPGTGTEFSPAWVTLNSGPISNNPSGTTVAVLFGSNSGLVSFDVPRSRVDLFFASASDVTLVGFDASSDSIGSASGATNAPPFDTWDPIEVDVGDNLIASINLSGESNGTAIDDLTSCVVSSAPPVSCEGFAAPIGDDPVTVRGKHALPLRATLIGPEGMVLTDTDIASPPVVEVRFSASGSASPPVDVTGDAQRDLSPVVRKKLADDG